MKSLSKTTLYLAAGAVTVALGGTAVAAEVSDRPDRQPYVATAAAANGREVPAQVVEQFQNQRKPRVLGRDSRGQEYALSRGTGGVCLIAVRDSSRPGFEACAPNLDMDVPYGHVPG